MKKFKKQFLAAALVVALGAAVYLNWSLTSPKTVSKTLGESKFVNATISTEKLKKASNNKIKTDTLTDKQKQFFAAAKNTRDTTQDKVIDKAAEVLGMDSSSKGEKTKAQANVAAIIKNFTLQDTIESTLKAKGFSNCLSYINENGCTVTLLNDELKKLKPVLVKSTVQSVTNISFDNITIVTI